MFTLYSFYRSNEWERFRKTLFLERLNEKGDLICSECGEPIAKAYDTILHHVKELKEENVNDYEISLNPENVVFVHHKCHNNIHNRFGNYTRHIYLVWGSPCAGKSTFVNERALKDDIIVDIDRIFEAINNSRSNRVFSNVMQIYQSLIDMIKTRNGKWINAWIIRATCKPMDLERLANDVGAEKIHIDTSKEICLERAILRNEIYPSFVEKYFEDFERYKNLLEG